MKHLFGMALVVILLAGCDSYRPEKLPKGSVLQPGTVIMTSVHRSVSVVANQSETIYLKIHTLFGKKVRDLLIEAELTTIAGEGVALLEPVKLRVSAGAMPLSGNAYSDQNPRGLSIGCGQPDPSRCGVFEIERDTAIQVKLLQPLDLSGIVITMAESQ